MYSLLTCTAVRQLIVRLAANTFDNINPKLIRSKPPRKQLENIPSTHFSLNWFSESISGKCAHFDAPFK